MFQSMTTRRGRPSAVATIGTVALAAALGGGAYAAIPGGDGTIKGCYATTDGLLLGIPHSKGDLRAIDEAATCRSYEKQISWNQRGPQGPAGPQGPPVAGLGSDTGNADPGRGEPCTLGEVLLTAGAVANGTPAIGQLLPINQNFALFSLLGTTYGGNGTTTFALPDLRSVAPDHMTYSICVSGSYPARG